MIPDQLHWTGRADVRLRLEPEPDAKLFVGIAPAADVDAYLAGVTHDRIERFDAPTRDVTYEHSAGDTAPAHHPATRTSGLPRRRVAAAGCSTGRWRPVVGRSW